MNLSRMFARASLVLFLSAMVFTTTPAAAAILFESGTLGPTGISKADVFNKVVFGCGSDFETDS